MCLRSVARPLLVCCALVCTPLVRAQNQTGEQAMTGPHDPPVALPAAAMESAVLLSALTFPSPGEFFAALAKAGRPSFTPAGRCTVPIAISERSRIALVVGILLADGYLAVENQSSQDMKNIGKDLIEMARKLNAGENVLARGRGITDFAENNDWNALREELEATRNEIRISLTAQKDPGLSLLVSMGAWLRSIHAGALVVSRQYAPEPSALFLQSALVDAWQKRAAILPARFLDDPWVAFTLAQTREIGALLARPVQPEQETSQNDSSAPDETTISRLAELTGFIIAQLVEVPPGESPRVPSPAVEQAPAEEEFPAANTQDSATTESEGEKP